MMYLSNLLSRLQYQEDNICKGVCELLQGTPGGKTKMQAASLVQLFENDNFGAIHAKHVIIMPKDIQLAHNSQMKKCK